MTGTVRSTIREARAYAARWKQSAARVRDYARTIRVSKVVRRTPLSFELLRGSAQSRSPLYVALYTDLRVDLGGIRLGFWRGRVAHEIGKLAKKSATHFRPPQAKQSGNATRAAQPVSTPMLVQRRNALQQLHTVGRSLSGMKLLVSRHRLSQSRPTELYTIDRWIGSEIDRPLQVRRLPLPQVAGDSSSTDIRRLRPFSTTMREHGYPHATSRRSRQSLDRHHIVRLQRVIQPMARPASLKSRRLETELGHDMHARVPRSRIQQLARSNPNASAASMGLVRPATQIAESVGRVFAVQERPLVGVATQRIAHDEPVTGRIERPVRKSVEVTLRETVRREIERKLAPNAVFSRRLRDSIQSELCDDIVFERERLGGR